MKLLQHYSKNGLSLTNRIVMAPMTRTRANYPGDFPTQLNADYYKDRASAGLIITEGVHVSEQAIGYLWVPGISTDKQIEGWKKVAHEVHQKGGKIVMQLFHTGRLSHPYFQQEGKQPVAPSAIQANGYNAFITNYHGQTIPIPFATPRAFETQEIPGLVTQFVKAAKNAIVAGFDGVEIHAANGYLLEQFINPTTNTRTDAYGGSIENRCRIVLEIAQAISNAIGKEKTGIRLSPFGKLHDMGEYSEAEKTNLYLAGMLNESGIGYLHLFNQGDLSESVIRKIKDRFANTLILCGGFTKESGEAAIENNLADLIAYGRHFIANPDLVERFKIGASLAESDQSLWYGSNGEAGYNTYPALQTQAVTN